MDINGTQALPTATDLLDLPDYAGRDFLEASGGGLSFTAQEPVFCCLVVVAAVVVVVDCILLYFTVLYLQVFASWHVQASYSAQIQLRILAQASSGLISQ